MSAPLEQWCREHQSEFAGQLLWDEPLSKHTYYRIGGPAALLAVPKGREDLAWLSRCIRETGTPSAVLGLGSNCLVSDDGYPGLVLKTGRIDLTLEKVGESRVRTGTSVAISSLLRRAAQEGWAGFELWTGIPGSIGGAVAMNAGTHLGETREIAARVEAFALTGPRAGETLVFEEARLKFEYRKSLFLPEGALVVSADWKIRQEQPTRVKERIDETLLRRKSTQPIDFPSCGSVFKNPRDHGLHAWQVIEKIGLRGHRVGGAEFSDKHCNFIVNLGGAKAADVRELIELAKARARDQLGIVLEEEVRYLG